MNAHADGPAPHDPARREFLATAAGLAAAAAAAGACASIPSATQSTASKEKKMPFTLPELPYAENALEPFIDQKTMNIHRTKHHQAYVDNLNKAVDGTPWATMSIDEIRVPRDPGCPVCGHRPSSTAAG